MWETGLSKSMQCQVLRLWSFEMQQDRVWYWYIYITFWINLLPPSSGQKNKDGGSMFLYQTAQGYIPAQETNHSPYYVQSRLIWLRIRAGGRFLWMR
jgi:hypothetical protein